MENLTRINKILFFIIMVFAVLYIGKSFLIPFVFGIFFASLMTPLTDYLEKKHLSNILASTVSTLIIFIVLGGIFYLFIHQMSVFLSDISSIRNALESFLQDLQNQIASITNISLAEQKNMWEKRSEEIAKGVESLITGFFGDLLYTTINFLLVMIYVFLLLLYRKKFTKTILMYVHGEKEKITREILEKFNKVAYHYLWGRAKVMSILAVMYLVTFMAFGLPYALLLTIFGSLVTIIPYLGPFISGIIPVLLAAIYFDGLKTAFLLIIVVSIIQLIESYVIEPLILGREVRLNPLMVIIAIILGEMVWGLAGMILFVPIFAMFKILSKRSHGLEPIAFLFGSGQRDKN